MTTESTSGQQGSTIERGLTRRTLIGAAAAGGAAAVTLPVLGAEAATPKKYTRRIRGLKTADVIVVGAGLAGSTCAHELHKAGKSVIVLEARNRVGGRTFSNRIPGTQHALERGGEALFRLEDQSAIVALGKEVGEEATLRGDTGNNLYIYRGNRLEHDKHGPTERFPPSPGAAPEMIPMTLKLEQMAAEVDLRRPWEHPNALEWDSQTFESFVRENLKGDEARFLNQALIESLLAAHPRDFSLLFTLAGLARFTLEPKPNQTKIQTIITTYGDYRFARGVQTISVKLAQRLGLERRVFLNAPVRRIEQDRKGVTVVSDRVMARGKRVVVAMPPAVTNFIQFVPELPAPRAQLAQRYPQGSMIKCHALYDTPFWEEDGYTGEVIWDGEPCRYAFPGNPPEGKPGVMTGYIPAHNARVWVKRTPEERRDAVLRNFAEFFGSRALKPFDFREMVWASEEYTRGGFAGIAPPGVLLDFGEEIHAPAGRIHWSGTENAIEWYGTLEGAVRSGLNSAKEVLPLV